MMKQNADNREKKNLLQKTLDALFTATLLGGLVISLAAGGKYPIQEWIGVWMIVISMVCAILFTKTEYTAHYRCTKCKRIHIPDRANPLTDKQTSHCPVCNEITTFEKM